jgi:GNAT superfamily N-acetyltransferase
MQRYANYIKEKCDAELIETDSGFITYSVNGDTVHVHDAYVDADKRRQGASKDLVGRIIELEKPKRLTSCLQLSANNVNETLITQLCFGFRLIGANDKELYLVKEL